MQSASWFAPPEFDSSSEGPSGSDGRRHPRQEREPLPPPTLDDKLIAAALEKMESGEVLGALPERPPRQTPAWTKAPPAPSSSPESLHSTTAATLPPHPSSPEAEWPPVPVPEAVVDEVPPEQVTDPGSPGFSEEEALAAVPVPEAEPRSVEDFGISTDVIPEAFRVEPQLRSASESPYLPPIAPSPAEPAVSRFLDLEHSEPPASARELETAWFSDLGQRPAQEHPLLADEGPAWTLDRESSLADTLVRPSAELEPMPVPVPEDAAAAVPEPAPAPAADVQISSPMIDVFRRSAVLENSSSEAAPVPETPVPETEASETDSEAPANRVVRARVASIGARSLAWLVDGALLAATITLFALAAAKVAGTTMSPLTAVRDPLIAAGLLGLAAVVGAVYAAVGALFGGQTFGARLARVRVLDRSGRPPGLSRSLLRGVSASLGTLFFLIGLVWVVVDDRGQALHDKIASTYVVRT